jgi:hypothetical protein
MPGLLPDDEDPELLELPPDDDDPELLELLPDDDDPELLELLPDDDDPELLELPPDDEDPELLELLPDDDASSPGPDPPPPFELEHPTPTSKPRPAAKERDVMGNLTVGVGAGFPVLGSTISRARSKTDHAEGRSTRHRKLWDSADAPSAKRGRIMTTSTFSRFGRAPLSAFAVLAMACMACGSSSTSGASPATDGGGLIEAGVDATSIGPGVEGGSASGPDGSSGLDVAQGGDAQVQGDASRAADAATGADANALNPVLLGVDATGNAEFSMATGLKAQVVRVYLKGGDSIPNSVTAANLMQYYSAGESVVYSIKPDLSPDSENTNKANLAALAASIVSGGYASKTWIALHHEPYHELTGAQFQTMYGTYAPSVRSGGVRCGVIYQTYPLTHGEATYAPDYTSGILAEVDYIGIDVYPDSTSGGYSTAILDVIAPFTTYAKDNGKPFQIDEIAVDSTVTGTQAQEAAWLAGLANLGPGAQVVMYYEGTPGGFPHLIIENNPAAVTEWQMLYQTLTTR